MANRRATCQNLKKENICSEGTIISEMLERVDRYYGLVWKREGRLNSGTKRLLQSGWVREPCSPVLRASLRTGSAFEGCIVELQSLSVASATALRKKFPPLMTAVTWPA